MGADGKNKRTCCKLLLNLGVRPINIWSLLLSIFIANLIMALETAFTSYLLRESYDLHGDKVAEVTGNLGLVGDLGSVASELLSGPAMDLFGRKSLSIGGLVVASVAMIVKPLFKSISWLYILKLLTNMGIVPLMYSPYPTDYIARESLGLFTTGYLLIAAQFSTILSTSGAIQIQKVLPASYVYYAVGILALVVSIFLLFGLTDVHDKSKSKPKTIMFEDIEDEQLI